MLHRLPINLKLDTFEGPLDLLLYLIQSHELKISAVSLTQITDQYLAYVRLMQELNFDTASDFLVMAATLLFWKSQALLPKEIDPAAARDAVEDPGLTQEQLLQQLKEHQQFLDFGQRLGERPLLGDDVFVRPNRKPPIEKLWKDLSVTELALGYQNILVRQRMRTRVLQKETVSLEDKIQEFARILVLGQVAELKSLFPPDPTRGEQVVTFLAALELTRLKKMRLFQEQPDAVAYATIYLELLESLAQLDQALFIGFQAIAPPAAPS